MSGLVIGIDLGGTKTLVAAIDPQDQVLFSERRATRVSAGVEAVLDDLVESVALVEARTGRAERIGVGFAGLVDHRTGTVDSSVILPGWDGVSLRDRLRNRLERTVFVDNDATAAGWGEFRALGSPATMTLLVITVGTGIGGAIVVDGRLFRGATNTSGEFGNMTIDWEGREHASGNRGSLNTLASGTAIAQHAAQLAMTQGGALAGLANVRLEDVASAAALDDAVAHAAIDRGARALGTGIANLLNAFNPDRVALMGGVLSLGPAYLDVVREVARSRAFRSNAEHAVIAPCVAGESAGVCGIAALVREVEPEPGRDG